MKFLDPYWLAALWVVPVAALLVMFAMRRRRAALMRMVGPAMSPVLTVGYRARRAAGKAALAIGAIALVVLAMARPGWNPRPQQITRGGRDVAVLIDVSRSMLAQDVKPSRLERAKLIVKDIMDSAQGDRIGIVAFAGSASVRAPLTTDYTFAKLALDNLTPLSVVRGGTLIGDAIRTALEQVFDDAEDRYRDIILITDGEDHESFPEEAARLAADRGIRIIAIGLGSDLAGAIIPLTAPGASTSASDADVVTYQGETVRSRMDPDSLKRVATATPGGVFLNVGTGNLQMDKVYRQLMARAERREVASELRLRYQEGFQLFLGLAFALLVVEGMISERTRR